MRYVLHRCNRNEKQIFVTLKVLYLNKDICFLPYRVANSTKFIFTMEKHIMYMYGMYLHTGASI